MSGDDRVAKNGWQMAFRELLFPGRFPEAGDFRTGKTELERARQGHLNFKIEVLKVQYCWSDTGIVKRAVFNR